MKIVYLNKEENFEEFAGYVRPKKMSGNNKNNFLNSEQLVTTGLQRRYGITTGTTNCLVLNAKATEIKNIEDNFHV